MLDKEIEGASNERRRKKTIKIQVEIIKTENEEKRTTSNDTFKKPTKSLAEESTKFNWTGLEKTRWFKLLTSKIKQEALILTIQKVKAS